jgi:hypothetical protein
MTVEPAEMVATPVATDLLAPVQTTPPSLAEPEMLVKGLRYLQQRIPEFTHLSVQEKRSHARAANSGSSHCNREASPLRRRFGTHRSELHLNT